MKICIDPGHSGPFEPGACAGGVTEAAINMEIAMWLAISLREAGQDVLLTREGDINSDSLAERCRMANEWGADLFISIHCNAATNPDAHGFEVYHYPGSEAGRELAERIRTALAALNYTLDRGVKEARFTVLERTAMPAALVECGFITSPAEAHFLLQRDHQTFLASGLADGIVARE